jgi:hypothetical protein
MTKNNGDLSFKEIVKRYPDVPRLVIREIDTRLRGATLTDRAWERARESDALFDINGNAGDEPKQILGSAVLFRDGTSVGGLEAVSQSIQSPPKTLRKGSPYIIDVVYGELWLVDGQEPVEEVDFTQIPEFYGKKTSRGTPMEKVIGGSTPDCLHINVFGYCHFWKEKMPCKYCSYVPGFLKQGAPNSARTKESLEDIYETVNEALKEEGRWTAMVLVAGSDPTGGAPYENEINHYIAVLKTLRRCFGTEKIFARLVAGAAPKEQLERLAEAGATAYEPHIEVWDEKLFEWLCPGKAEYFGRQYWIDSALASVEVFGRGNVSNQVVGGAELAQPYGFKTIDEGLKSNFECAEFFAKHGIPTCCSVLQVGQGSIFFSQKQQSAPLEYYVRLVRGLRDITRKYRLGADFNDYRRCPAHPDTNFSRLDYHNVSNEPVAEEEKNVRRRKT